MMTIKQTQFGPVTAIAFSLTLFLGAGCGGDSSSTAVSETYKNYDWLRNAAATAVENQGSTAAYCAFGGFDSRFHDPEFSSASMLTPIALQQLGYLEMKHPITADSGAGLDKIEWYKKILERKYNASVLLKNAEAPKLSFADFLKEKAGKPIMELKVAILPPLRAPKEEEKISRAIPSKHFEAKDSATIWMRIEITIKQGTENCYREVTFDQLYKPPNAYLFYNSEIGLQVLTTHADSRATTKDRGGVKEHFTAFIHNYFSINPEKDKIVCPDWPTQDLILHAGPVAANNPDRVNFLNLPEALNSNLWMQKYAAGKSGFNLAKALENFNVAHLHSRILGMSAAEQELAVPSLGVKSAIPLEFEILFQDNQMRIQWPELSVKSFFIQDMDLPEKDRNATTSNAFASAICGFPFGHAEDLKYAIVDKIKYVHE